MSDVAVIIPWRHQPDRYDQLLWVLDQYELHHPDWHVVLGELPADEPWCKARAVTAGLEATEAPLLLVADADVWCDPGPAIDALTALTWAVPHYRVHRLTAEATDLVLDGADWRGLPLAQDPYPGHLGGGMVAIRRSTYLEVPLDHRFVGWGQEDDSWSMALATLAGPGQRFMADLVHLWHPEPDRLTRRTGTDDSLALFHRYSLAHGKPLVMAGLVDEIHQEVRP